MELLDYGIWIHFKEIINPIYIGREIHSVSFNNGNILACGL